MSSAETFWQIFGYFILPITIFIISTIRDIPKGRLILLSIMPPLLSGVIFFILGFNEGVGAIFASVFIPFLLYASFYPVLLLIALLYLQFLLKYSLTIRILVITILTVVGSIFYILSFKPKAIPSDGFFIVTSSALLGVLSILVDYWIWERERKE